MAPEPKLETLVGHQGESGEILSLLKKTNKKQRLATASKRTSSNSSQDATVESSTAEICNNKKPQSGAKQTTKKPQKPRRRVATMAQRRAANIRERRRMFNLNSAFDRLRKKVPSFAYEKRLSRIETLKLAIMYIRFMDDLVNDDAYAEKYKQLTSNVSSAAINSGSYLSLYGNCESLSPIPVQSQQQQQQQQQSLGGAPNLATSGNANLPVFACKQMSATSSNHMIGQGPVGLELIGHQGAGGNKFGGQKMMHHVASQRGSPSNSLACCSSSPASSPTMTTCHSSSTTFSESPSASPMIQLHSRSSPQSSQHQQHQHFPYYTHQQSYPVAVDLDQGPKIHYYGFGHSKDPYCRVSQHDATYSCEPNGYSRAYSGSSHQESAAAAAYEHSMDQIHQSNAHQSQHNAGPKPAEHPQSVQATY